MDRARARAARSIPRAPLLSAAILSAALLLRWALPSGDGASAAPASHPARAPASPPATSPAPAPIAALAPTPASPPPPDDGPGLVVVVTRGDSLWRLAGRHLGASGQWPRLHRANRDTVDDPDRITPGMRLVLPERTGAGR